MNIPWMDPYDREYPWDTSIDPFSAPFVDARMNLGYTVTYSQRIPLASMFPNSALSSTGYCLACTDTATAAYLVYSEWGGGLSVDLSATHHLLEVEWFDPASGKTFDSGFVDGGAVRTFIPPFTGDAVLYLATPTVTGIKQIAGTHSQIPEGVTLDQNYPNPFNPSTTIGFTLGTQGWVTLKIYDIGGAVATTLVDREMASGVYVAEWNATGRSGGMYFYRLDMRSVVAGKAKNYSMTKKFLLLK
jgi:hypothetical protein